jgi:hypothetical protein
MAERGGRRQGTPGKGYSNRTDLNVVRAPQQGLTTAAAGGQAPPPAPAPATPPGPPPPGIHPDQTPNVMDPGNPAVPLQDGLATGPGAGPAAPAPQNQFILRYLPMLTQAQNLQGAPDQFKSLVRFLQGM